MKNIRLENLNLNFEILPEDDEYYERIAASPSPEFWAEWQSKKATMKRKGFFVEKIGSEYMVMMNVSDISKYSSNLLEDVESAKENDETEKNSEFSDNPVADAFETDTIEKSSDWDHPITVVVEDEKTGHQDIHPLRTEGALTFFMQDSCPLRKQVFSDNWFSKIMQAWENSDYKPAKIFKHNGFLYVIKKNRENHECSLTNPNSRNTLG